MIRAVAPAFLVAFTVSSALHAQAGTDNLGRAGVAVGSVLDQILEDQARRKQTPLSIKRSGILPGAGEEVAAKVGEVVVSRVSFESFFMARPKEDYVSPRGVTVSAAEMRALRMLNGKFCTVQGGEGGHCFDDLDGDKDWDGAGKAKGRWVDVPYDVFEVRRPLPGGEGDRRELILKEVGLPAVLEYREWFAGGLVMKEPCTAPSGTHEYSCGGLQVTTVRRQGESVVFRVKESTSTAK